MDHAYLAVMLGTILMILAYVYFYVLYRERYMGLWTISWFIFFGRIVFFDYGPLAWKQSVMGTTIFQILIVINSLIFIWGTLIFINKPLKRYWLYVAATISLLSAIFTFLRLSLFYKLLFPLLFGGFTLFYIGKIFTHLQVKGIGKYVTGYAFIFWSLLTLFMPYSINIAWLSPWCYLLAGIARMIIALGILIVYFEKTRADLARKEAQYRLLAENAVDVIYRYRLSPETKFEYISPSALAVTGYAPEEYYADAGLLIRLIHPDDLPLFEDFVKNPSTPRDLPLSFRLIRKDQNTIWIEQKGVPIYDGAGNLAALEGILRDVTARKTMEEIMFRAEKMNAVGQMAVSLAHEIRNPLTSVRGYLQLMSMEEKHSGSKERYDLMINELDRTNMIITEYLLLAKDKIPNRKSCSLNTIIHALFPLLQAAAGASNVDLRLCLEDIPALYLDENEIRQLLVNLVNNALEAMPAGGELVIRTFRDRDKIVLSVSDQGPGIPPHILANLGTPFLTTKDTGTGLGLPVCYRIATRHDAAIHVETSDQGTTFFVQFSPLHPAA